MSKWNEKQAKKAEFAMNKMLDTGADAINFEQDLARDTRDAAMGKGDDELFEKKLSKEEKKALAKAKREAKKKGKSKSGKSSKKDEKEEEEKKSDDTTNAASSGAAADLTNDVQNMTLKEKKRIEALDNLSKEEIVVTYESKNVKIHANARDINVGGVTVAFHGRPLIEETDIVINYGNRYGLIGPNGSGKSTVMKAIAARSIPIPEAIDIYFLDGEYEAYDKTAIQAVF